MLPVVVIAGRPNVGKSTLFNRLAGRRAALVSDTPGVTRDRKEAEAMLRGRRVRLVDTAGLEEAAPETLPGRMRASAAARSGKRTCAVRGRCSCRRDGGRRVFRRLAPAAGPAGASWSPTRPRAAPPPPRSAKRTRLASVSRSRSRPSMATGIADLMSEIAERLPEADEDEDAEAQRPLKLAIVGRPNAGKSTLLNRLLGEERMITGPEPGLTRDAVAVILSDAEGRPIELVDTAGLRRRARIDAPLERMSVSASIEALKMAEVVVLTVDALEGMHDQDLQIAKLIEREGRACVIALNKWDAVTDRAATRRAIEDRLGSEPLADERDRDGAAFGAHRRGRQSAAPGGAGGARGLEHASSDWRTQPLVRGGASPPSAADRGGAAAQAALHHAGESAPAHFRCVRHPRRADAGDVSALSRQQPSRDVRIAGDADPAATARHTQSVRGRVAGTLPVPADSTPGRTPPHTRAPQNSLTATPSRGSKRMNGIMIQVSVQLAAWAAVAARTRLQLLRRWWRERSMANALNALDDAELKDIGVYRSEIPYIAHERAGAEAH